MGAETGLSDFVMEAGFGGCPLTDPLQLPSTIDYSQLACSGSSLATQVKSRI